MSDKILEYLIAEGHITQEQFDKKVEEAKKASLPIIINEDLGNALVVTFQNDNILGDMVMSLMIQNNDLANMVLELQNRLEVLENA